MLRVVVSSDRCVMRCWAARVAFTPKLFYQHSAATRSVRVDERSIKASKYKGKGSHTRLPSVGFRSWSRFLAVSVQVTWVINPAVGCHYFPPSLHLPPQPLMAATNFAAWWTEAQWVWTVCLRLLPDSVATAIWTQALLCLLSKYRDAECHFWRVVGNTVWSHMAREFP